MARFRCLIDTLAAWPRSLVLTALTQTAATMRNSLVSLFIKLTSYGWIIAAAGLALAGYLGYLHYQASEDHAYVARDKLQVIEGKVESAAQVTVTRKSRRSTGRVSNRYYEISVKPTTGEAKKLRLAMSVGRENVRSIIDEHITAMFDSDDENFAYDVRTEDRTVLAYETTRNNLVAEAQSKDAKMVSPGGFVFAFILFVVGVVTTYCNRKLRGQQPATA